VQHKATFGLHGSALKNGLLGQIGAFERQLHFVKQMPHQNIRRLVDHQAERTVFAVLAHVHHAAPE